MYSDTQNEFELNKQIKSLVDRSSLLLMEKYELAILYKEISDLYRKQKERENKNSDQFKIYKKKEEGAADFYRRLFEEIISSNNLLESGDALFQLGEFCSLSNRNEKSNYFYKQSVLLGDENALKKIEEKVAIEYSDAAFFMSDFFRSKDSNKSKYFFNNGIDLALRENRNKSKEDKADTFFSLAGKYKNRGKVKKAIIYYRLSAENGHTGALQTLEWFVGKKNKKACYELGLFYEKKDKIEEAVCYYTLAAKLQYPAAHYALFRLYLQMDKKEAAHSCLVQAALLGHCEAQM
jgi:TPR repeat protein